MKKYTVILRGENFEINYEDQQVNSGFYTTRIVKAKDEKEAENRAVELIKNDKSLISVIVKNSKLTPMIYLESISKAPFWRKPGGTGYSFWPMEEDNESL